MLVAVRRLVLGGLVAGVMLWAPTAAFACGGSSPSAVNVYVECLQNGGGAKPTHHSSTKPTKPVTVPPKAARKLAGAGPDKAVLANLVSGSGQGLEGQPEAQPTGESTAPSLLGSAFDLGSGPTALLLILAGTAVVLLGGSGWRFWRRRHDQV